MGNTEGRLSGRSACGNSGVDDLINAIEDGKGTEFWTTERTTEIVILYRAALNRLLRTHPRDDDEGLARKMSAFAASIGYSFFLCGVFNLVA